MRDAHKKALLLVAGEIMGRLGYDGLASDIYDVVSRDFEKGVPDKVTIDHDWFTGDIIGAYRTREGKPGVVLQQENTKVVHVYGEKWID